MIGTLKLPTFSLNAIYTVDNQKKVFKLIDQLNEQNCDIVGEAFIRIMEGKKTGTTPTALSQYAKQLRKHNGTTKIEEEQVSLEEQIEGSDFQKLSSSTLIVSFEDEAIMRCDTDNMVEQFLKFRQEWYFKDGHDISRLLQLALRDGDIQATLKLRRLFVEKEEMDYLKYLLENSEAIEKIKKLLWR